MADAALPTASLLTNYTIKGDGHESEIPLAQSGYESVPETQRTRWIDADKGALPAIAASLVAHLRSSRP